LDTPTGIARSIDLPRFFGVGLKGVFLYRLGNVRSTPQKRTSGERSRMSALGQNRTKCIAANKILFGQTLATISPLTHDRDFAFIVRSKATGVEAMDQKTFTLLAGVIFGIVALLHLLRIYMGWPIVIADWTVPMWVSWIGLVVAGGLSYFGLSLTRHR
jgi:hypothetical protein